jgi:hypothetical protein
MSPLLAIGATHSHHRACDAVLLALVNGKLIAVFVELKSSGPAGYVGQLKGTRCFFHYLLRIAKEFHDITFDSVEERFVVFHGPKLGKRTLNKKPTLHKAVIGKHSTDPNNPLKELVSNGVTIPLKALLT